MRIPRKHFADRLTFPNLPSTATIQERFEAFHEANPWVFKAYVREIYHARAIGFKRVGIGFITELLRWQYAQKTKDAASAFKINNDYRSRYARLIAKLIPDLSNFITSRELRSR